MTTRQFEPILERALASCGVPSARRTYETDRDNAIAWYRQQGFPSHHPESPIGRQVLKTLALTASDQGVWREAWAGFHRLIAELAPGRRPQDIAEACLEIGRAHIAMHAYDLATVYLQCAQNLADQHPQTGFKLHVTAALSVFAVLRGSLPEYQDIIADLLDNPESAEQVAAMTFKEGTKNARWADDQGHRCPDDLKLADAQLNVSLDLNKGLRVWDAVGVILCELGDVQKHTGNRARARELYEESLKLLTSAGRTSTCAAVEERLRKLLDP